MKNLTACLLLFLSISIFAQDDYLYVYDFTNQTLDSVEVLNNMNETSDQTSYFIGSFNSEYETLDENPPTDNLFPNSTFTLKEKVTDEHDITKFPIRTTVKLYYQEDGELIQYCTGNLVGRRHVLMTTHCFFDFNTPIDIPRSDSMLVCPIFNDGTFSTDFPCTSISKVYFSKDWQNSKDIALVELKDPIGEETGWIGFGFNEDDNFYTYGVYHKFSYPIDHIPQIDPIEYNGDTLYHSYGKVDLVQGYFLGIDNARAINGESGSSIILVENETNYTSHGVLVWSTDLRHTRIEDWVFYTFENIIEESFFNEPTAPVEPIVLFPNPSIGFFSIKGIEATEIKSIKIIDVLGRYLKSVESVNSLSNIDVSFLASGIYYIEIETDDLMFSNKLIIVED